jgi:hypothetical protein
MKGFVLFCFLIETEGGFNFYMYKITRCVMLILRKRLIKEGGNEVKMVFQSRRGQKQPT